MATSIQWIFDGKDASDKTFYSNDIFLPEHKFYCTSGECIYQSSVCDGFKNCRSGSVDVASCEIFCPADFYVMITNVSPQT